MYSHQPWMTKQQARPATAVEIVTAQEEGASAFNDRVKILDCPYMGDEDDRTRYLRLMWLRGYLARKKYVAQVMRSRLNDQ